MKWLQDQFCDAKSVKPGAVNDDTTATHAVFESGKGGIYLTGPYVLARFDKSIGNDKYRGRRGARRARRRSAAPWRGRERLPDGRLANEEGQQKFAEFAVSAEGQKIGMDGDDRRHHRPAAGQHATSTWPPSGKDPRWEVFQKVYDDAGRNAPAVPNWAPFRQISAEGAQRRVCRLLPDVRRRWANWPARSTPS